MSRWIKGQSGNRRGRPKAGTAIAELARRQLDKHKLVELLGSIAAGEVREIGADQQLRAIQLLLAYGYGPPRQETEAIEGFKIQVIYAEINHIAIAGATPGPSPRDSGSEALQCRLLRAPLGQDSVGDGSPDSSGSAG
jgi:hypothetical protein